MLGRRQRRMMVMQSLRLMILSGVVRRADVDGSLHECAGTCTHSS